MRERVDVARHARERRHVGVPLDGVAIGRRRHGIADAGALVSSLRGGSLYVARLYDAMRLVRPATVEQFGASSRRLGGVGERRTIGLVCTRFRGRHEPGAEPHAVGAQRQGGSDPAAVSDTPRGDDRNVY